MSATWSKPYVKLVDPTGSAVDWQLPADLTGPATSLVDLGAPADARVQMRWRAPGEDNARSRRLSANDPATLTLLRTLAGARLHPEGFTPDASGQPVPTSHPGHPAAAAGSATAARAHSGSSALTVLEQLDPGARCAISERNMLVRAAAAGELALGATISDLIAKIIAKRQPTWGGKHDGNQRNVLAFVDHVLRYRPPTASDDDDTAAWKRARLAIPGVEIGGSLHVALILPPDLDEAIDIRRHTDRRAALLNEQSDARFGARWDHYLKALAEQQAGTHRGRMPNRPPDAPKRYEPKREMSARTEELFAGTIGMLLRAAERQGRLLGPNPWDSFAEDGFRRPETMVISKRVVPAIGAVIQLADAIAKIGPIDRSTGLPVGDRFRALVLTAAATYPRTYEMWGVRPQRYMPGAAPTIEYGESAGPVNTASTADGSSWERRPSTKRRRRGDGRVQRLPRMVADALDQHIARGYASPEYLFTAPEGGPVRWGNVVDEYWRPAVEQV
ncbi:MAG TPA: hypothetical protein VIH37_03115, partial [Candidatus Limnocylindrales bacterium]